MANATVCGAGAPMSQQRPFGGRKLIGGGDEFRARQPS
jgi:hypothetical protein